MARASLDSITVCAVGITGYTSTMKTAVSLPEDLFVRIERWTQRARTSRSRFFALAATEYLARHEGGDDPTSAWDRAVAEAGPPGDDPSAAAFRRRTKRVLRGKS